LTAGITAFAIFVWKFPLISFIVIDCHLEQAHTWCLLNLDAPICRPEHHKLLIRKSCWKTYDDESSSSDEDEMSEEDDLNGSSGSSLHKRRDHLLTSSLSKDDKPTPLLVFVNSKSGGQQGLHLLRKFRRLLEPNQVIDINLQGPVPALKVFRGVKRLRVLVCGGDGTVGWVLKALDKFKDWRPPVCLHSF
jgi:hypothetical protein